MSASLGSIATTARAAPAIFRAKRPSPHPTSKTSAFRRGVWRRKARTSARSGSRRYPFTTPEFPLPVPEHLLVKKPVLLHRNPSLSPSNAQTGWQGSSRTGRQVGEAHDDRTDCRSRRWVARLAARGFPRSCRIARDRLRGMAAAKSQEPGEVAGADSRPLRSSGTGHGDPLAAPRPRAASNNLRKILHIVRRTLE